jgi:hypothetical protein
MDVVDFCIRAAKGLQDHPEIVAYHRRAIVVIGRSHDWDEDKLKALHGLNRRLPGIMVMTYEQLLAQGERLVDMLISPEKRTVLEDEIEWDPGIIDGRYPLLIHLRSG